MAAAKTKGASSAASEAAEAAAPGDLLRDSLRGLTDAFVQRASHGVTSKLESTTKNLAERGENVPGLGSGAKNLAAGKPFKAMAGMGAARVTDKVKQTVQNLTGGTKGGGGGRGKIKVTNIVETADVGVPVSVAYDQWTRFTEFPSFMKKVEHVEQKSEERLAWTAQIFWSHRSWESKIVEQVPDERIVWTSKGDKGSVNGAVSFHELAPSLTRIMVVLVYQPRGLFEHVGNVFRAQGRRARLEIKHFQRQVMTDSVLHADDLEGWRGEIHDGKVAQPEDDRQDQSDENDNENEIDGKGEGTNKNADNGADENEPEEPGKGAGRRGSRSAGARRTAESDRRGSAAASRTTRRGADADDTKKQARPASGSQKRPARARGTRSAGKAGAS